MRISIAFVTTALLVGALALLCAPEAAAYERYKDPATNSGNCSSCHGDFTDASSAKPGNIWTDDKHDVHRRQMIAGICNACHLGGDGRNPFLNQSDGTADLPPVGCVGCHGRFYTMQGQDTAPGLRLHHEQAGVTECLTCHTTDPLPLPEDVLPTYYGLPGINITDSCNSDGSENWTTDGLGLDNDGDGLYDGGDPDCAGNQAPVAVDDAYTTDEEAQLVVAAPGVLANDSDPDGDPITAVLDAGPANGALGLNADGSFTYDPDPDFFGTDSFTYHANDGTLDSNVATVTITVNAVNDPPVAADDAYSTDEDVTLNVAVPGVVGNDTDVDGDPLTAVVVTSTGNGALTLNADGSFTYDPDPEFSGTDSFTYVANDGTVDSNVATVSITVNTVNDPPVAADDAYSTDEDTPLNVAAPGVLANDTDADGDPLTAVLDAGPANGSLGLNADGSFTYTPNLNFFGSDSFTYHANDGALNSNVATVTITVNDVNDPPVADANGPYAGSEGVPVIFDGSGSSDVDGTIATYLWDFGDGNTGMGVAPTHTYVAAGTYTVVLTVTDDDGATDTDTTTADIAAVNNAPVAVDDAYSTDEDVVLNVAAPGVLANDTDADGDPLTAVLDTPATNGSLTLNADGSFSYTPSLNFFGTDSFTYHANDGQADSNIATVTITVNDVNDPPVADANGPYAGAEGVSVIFDGSGSSDVDGTIATYMWDFGDGSTGVGVSPSHTYAAAGLYTVTLTVIDDDGATDTDTTTADIGAVNNAPVAVDDAYSTDEDVPLSVAAPGALANDSDADGDPLTAVLDAGPANGSLGLNADGSFTYTPSLNFFGTDSFTYYANDGQADSNVATVTITVNDVNDPPVADANGPYRGFVGDPITFDGSGSSDVDGTIATYLWDFGDGNTGMGVAPTHTYAAAGTYTATLTVTDDDGATNSDSATVTVEERRVDLDIVAFRASKRVRLGSKKGHVSLKLTVQNNGSVDEPRPATITGLLPDGTTVVVFDQLVADTLGNGKVSYATIYTPTMPGDILWTATIFDDDPDLDQETATTSVVN